MTLTLTSADADGSLHFLQDDGPRINVTALLVVRHGGEHLQRTLAALGGSTRKPDRLVLIDDTDERLVHGLLAEHPQVRSAFPDVSVVTVPADSTFADTVDIAVEALPEPGEDVVVPRRTRTRADKRPIRPRDRHEWLWLLHEDNVPDAAALEALIATVSRSSRIGIAGCKVHELDQRRRLVNVGLEVTRTGRHIGERMQGEFDQGQHDTRNDVLAVSSSGLLIRRDVYATLGGFDPAFDGDGDGLDLCWRAHLTGHQVVIVPGAVVHQDLSTQRAQDEHRDPDLPAPRSTRTLRRHRQVALARSSLLGLPLMSVWILVSGLVLGLAMLLVKRPRRAFSELVQATAPFGIPRIIGARSRFFGRSTARRRYLQPLFVGTAAAWTSARDSLRSAVTLQETPAEHDLVGEGTGETGPVDDDAQELAAGRRPARRLLRSPGLWVLLAALVVAGLQWRRLLGSRSFQGRSGSIVGAELRPFGTDSAGIWQLYTDRWTGAGVGGLNHPGDYLPALWPFAWLIEKIPGLHAATSGQTAVLWLLALSVPLATISAYRAGRVLTPHAWPRAVVALLWATTAVATTASAQGRLGVAVGLVLAPLAFAGVVAIARPRATATMTFATVAVSALMGLFAPLLLAFSTAAAVFVLIGASGWARLRALVVVLAPWPLLGVYGWQLLDDPRRIFAGPGNLVTGPVPDVRPWEVLLLHPGGPGSYPVLLGIPLLALAAYGLLRGRRHKLVLAAAFLGLAGLALALAAPDLVVMNGATGPRTPWRGLPLAVFALACAAIALSALPPRLLSTRADRATVHPALGALAGCSALAVAALAGWNGVVDTLRPVSQPLPSMVQSQFTGIRSVRALVLTADADGTVSYRVQGREVSKPVTDFDLPAPSGGNLTAVAVGDLLRGQGEAAADALHRLAVGFVVVTGDSSGRRQLTTTLQNAGSLVAMSAPGARDVWRVAPQNVADGSRSIASSRIVLAVDGQPQSEVRTQAWHSETSVKLPAGAAGRQIWISEGVGWHQHADVRFAGQRLRPVPANGVITYALPASAGTLTIENTNARPRTRAVQLALWALVIFVALPFGNRASRRRAW
ncbi:glycosyltransferase [Yimella sp. cx-51]|uniref:glycosyltransferase n=1 Tax=Yimella sp. cx-51 TaxID=2770551 RepID=UPI00165E5688|nr:glycosyltransferase [Yimella sp. cx-51]MBC9958086.1 glycosyltransferase family 2 protein [Yimella sp. cx-51]QTH38868.1 glycosyltransferase family 2 protein [Yimella sp. cx-51]